MYPNGYIRRAVRQHYRQFSPLHKTSVSLILDLVCPEHLLNTVLQNGADQRSRGGLSHTVYVLIELEFPD